MIRMSIFNIATYVHFPIHTVLAVVVSVLSSVILNERLERG